MQRICSSLANAGYDINLVGRKEKKSLPLQQKNFKQIRLNCFFEKGFLFYAEHNLRLLFFLLFQKVDCICAIDLDTILPCLFLSKLKSIPRSYDAHELFCEMKEVSTRPNIYRFWKFIEKHTVPRFKKGYTVNEYIRDIFYRTYGVQYEVIRNVPYKQNIVAPTKTEDFIIYQGAVNEGRSLETVIPAFQWIDHPFHIYGNGNFYKQCEDLIVKYKLQGKVILKGSVLPDELKPITKRALLGIALVENQGLNNYYSLANRFFDYIQAGIPQLCANYPAYQKINEEFEVALLIEDLSPESIAHAVNTILNDSELQNKLRTNAIAAGKKYNWESEEKKLISFYQQILSS